MATRARRTQSNAKYAMYRFILARTIELAFSPRTGNLLNGCFFSLVVQRENLPGLGALFLSFASLPLFISYTPSVYNMPFILPVIFQT